MQGRMQTIPSFKTQELLHNDLARSFFYSLELKL